MWQTDSSQAEYYDRPKMITDMNTNGYNPLINQAKAITKLEIVKLVIQESGTYNPVQMRPYTSIMDHHSLQNIVERANKETGKVSGARLAGAVSNIIQPTATSNGEIGIANGWGERRVRFFLEVRCSFSFGSDSIYYFQGYSDWCGIGNAGSIAHDMVFYINSYIKVIRTVIPSPTGNVDYDRVVESKHLIGPNMWVNSQQFQQGPGSNLAMRPYDIFRGMQTQELTNDLSRFADSSPFDTRVAINSVMHSNRSHSLPTNYLANVIDTYMVGAAINQFGESQSELLGRVLDNSGEEGPGENPFIRALSSLSSTGVVNYFTMAMLEKIEPGVERNKTTTMLVNPNSLSKMHQAGSTSYWNASDRETLVATILTNSVPSIMMELMISFVHFRSTNHDIGGLVTTAVINCKCLTSSDFSGAFELFKRRFEIEVIRDFTFNNEELYSLEMMVDLFGETRITLSLAGQPAIDYVNPSFCDSLFLPVITNNSGNFNHVVEDFKTIVTQVADNRNPGAGNMSQLARYTGGL